MARIGRKGRLWLRAFHVFFIAVYIGGTVMVLVILASMGSAQSDSGLQAMPQIAGAIGIGQGTGMAGTMITGLLLSWLTPWGFFKHKWVVYSGAITVLAPTVYLILTMPLRSNMAALAEAEGLRALQNPEYISAWNRFIILHTVYLLLLVSAVFVSVIKPWEKRKGAEATS